MKRRAHRIVRGFIVAAGIMSAIFASKAQESNYSAPSFDAEHDHDSFVPVETVDLYSGALLLAYRDIHLPGPDGFDLNVVRWYSSKINRWDANCIVATFEETPLGIGWQMHMGRLWDNPLTGGKPAFRLELPGGQQEEFFTNNTLGIPNADYVSKNAWILYDEVVAGLSYQTAVSPSGFKYRFGVANRKDPDNDYLYLSEIVNPIGSKITVTYADRGDSKAYVDTVTDAFGRVVSFFYLDNTVHLDDPDRLDRITVLDHTGATATYDYNVVEAAFTFHNVLGSFTLPVGLTTTYDYSVQSGDSTNDVELKTMTLPTGGTVSYQYQRHTFFYPLRNFGSNDECTRVMNRKTVDGAGIWDYTYPTGTATDRTTVVNDALGHQQNSTFARYSDSGSDRIWKSGLLERRELFDGTATKLLEENFDYAPKEFSADNVSPKSGYTELAYAPLLVEKRTTFRNTKTSKITWGGHDAYNNPGFMSEYDFSSLLYRTSRWEFEHSNADGDDTTFANAHLVDRVTRVTVEDSSSAIQSEVRKDYDSSSGSGAAFGNASFEEGWYDALTGDGSSSGYTRTEYDYDAVGDVAVTRQVAGASTRTTNFTYDHGILKKVTTGGTVILDRVVNANTSLVVSQIDANGFATTFNYDKWRRLTSVTPPSYYAPTTIVYDNATGATVTVRQDISEVVYAYDHFGRLSNTRTKMSPVLYSYQKVGYDAKGQVQYRYEASNSANPTTKTTFGFDGLGRITQAADPDGTSTFAYGADTVTITDPEGHQTAQTTDAFGRVIQAQEPGGFVTTYGYDRLDRLTSVLHPGTAGTRTLRYNSLGWLLEETLPESGVTRYGYNAFGALAWKRDATASQSNYLYDTRGRLKTIDLPDTTDIQFYYDGAPVPGVAAHTYFNALNKLTGMTDGTGAILWTDFDNTGRISFAWRTTQGAQYEYWYGYDVRGNLNHITYPRRNPGEVFWSSVDYTYGEANLVDTVLFTDRVSHLTATIVSHIDYNPALTPTRFVYGNGVTIEIPTSPALRNRPDRIYTTGVTRSGIAADMDLNYGYNTRGLINSVVTNGRSDSYSYTPRGFLSQVIYGGQGTVNYDYDATGNMTSRQSVAFAGLNFNRTYAGNRVVGFSYGPSGNLSSDGGQSYSYVAHAKLRAVTGVSEYQYDGRGLRAEARFPAEDRRTYDMHDDQGRILVRFAATLNGSGSREREYIYAAGHLVATRHEKAVHGVGNTLHADSDLSDVVLSWQPPPDGCAGLYRVVRNSTPDLWTDEQYLPPATFLTSWRDVGAKLSASDIYYDIRASVGSYAWNVFDHRGSTRLVLDANGEILGEAEEFPFGEPKTTPSCVEWEGDYQGAMKEEQTGLYDLGARHYSGALTRFLVPDRAEPDPRRPLTFNSYVYGSNDPMNLVDPDGHTTVTAHGGINFLRNIDISSDGRGFSNVREIAVNAVAGSVSDALGLDSIADGIAVAGNSDLSGKQRVWGGTKAAGVAILDVAGGVIVRRVVGPLFRWARVFGKGSGVPTETLEALENGFAQSSSEVASGGRLPGQIGNAAEEAVSAELGVPRNTGPGRVTVPGTGRGGFRVPDFDPGVTIQLRGAVVEVKNVQSLAMTPQLRDLANFARSQGAVLEIFTNAPAPTRGELLQLIQRGSVVLRPIP